jgi:hypothetical protein
MGPNNPLQPLAALIELHGRTGKYAGQAKSWILSCCPEDGSYYQAWADSIISSRLYGGSLHMSLLVNAYTRGDGGEMVILESNDPSEELAGFEVFRKTFYGGQTARSLGLRLLPVLADADLYVEGRDLDVLQAEAELVLQNVDRFADEAAASPEMLRFRMQNILNAVARAQAANGGVVVW